MKKLGVILALLASSAHAQSVRQSGNITPGHIATWVTTGVIADGGSAGGGATLSGSFTLNDFVCANATSTTPSIIDCGFSATGINNWVGVQNFNGGATAPTRSVGDNTANLATTAFVIAQGVGGGVILSGTPSVGYVPVATSPTTAVWGSSTSAGFTFTGGVSLNTTVAGCTESPGVRGPFYICNDNNGTSAAGYALGWQVWIGNNPTAALGANDAIATFTYINNLNGRGPIWANNTVCQQATVAAGGTNAINHCVELDVNQSIVATTPLSGFSFGAVSHGVEYVSSANASASIFPPQAAVWVWSAGDVSASQEWWNFAVAASRVHFAGLDCEVYSGGDATSAFTKGCVWDQSNSVNSLLVAGTHTSIIDASGATFTNFLNAGSKEVVFTSARGVGADMIALNNTTGGNDASFTLAVASVPKLTFGYGGAASDFFVFSNSLNAKVLSIPVATGNATFSGQIYSATGTPTIASGACGTTTNGAVVMGSTNQSGNITIGAAATTTCTLSWSATLTTAPNACVFFPENATAAATGTTVARTGAPSTTGVVLTGSALANSNYSYICL